MPARLVSRDVRKSETLKAAGEMVGNHVKVKVVKNKIAPPFKTAEFDIMFGKGISKSGDIIDLAEKTSIICKSGAWYSYKGEKIGQGRENTKHYLEEHPEIMEEVEEEVRKKYGIGGETPSAPSAPSAQSASSAQSAPPEKPSKKKSAKDPLDEDMMIEEEMESIPDEEEMSIPDEEEISIPDEEEMSIPDEEYAQ